MVVVYNVETFLPIKTIRPLSKNAMCFNILQAFPDNAAKREVEALEAVCINEGCSWTGTIKEYEVRRIRSV